MRHGAAQASAMSAGLTCLGCTLVTRTSHGRVLLGVETCQCMCIREPSAVKCVSELEGWTPEVRSCGGSVTKAPGTGGFNRAGHGPEERTELLMIQVAGGRWA